ncbi:MAG: glycosyltransferase [Burkholderiales bacterium]|nr:glycosyltransferase [Burkholderiales bacterium]
MTEHVPLVSVVVPYFAHERFIVPCLDSIAAQSYRRIELLIIDDGSPDEGARRIRQWLSGASSRFERVHFESRSNRGPIPTLNELITLARGEIVAPIASDDLFLPDSIELRVEALRRHPEVNLVFGDALAIDASGHVIADSFLKSFFGVSPYFMNNPGSLACELILNWCVPGPAFAVRRRYYEDAGLYDTRFAIEDRAFYLRVLANGGLRFVPAVLGVYRVIQQSLSRPAEPAALSRNYAELRRIELDALERFCGWKKLLLRVAVNTWAPPDGHPRRRILARFPWRVLRRLLLGFSRLVARVHQVLHKAGLRTAGAR